MNFTASDTELPLSRIRLGELSVQQCAGRIQELMNSVFDVASEKDEHLTNQIKVLQEMLVNLGLQLNEVKERLGSRPLPTPRTFSKVDEEMSSMKQAIKDLNMHVQGLQPAAGYFKTFRVVNPLKLFSYNQSWDSPVTSLGGPNGYRARMRVVMSDALGQWMSIFICLVPGPNDDWLQWPLPSRRIVFAVFCQGGQKPLVKGLDVNARAITRPKEGDDPKYLGIAHFISIDDFLDESKQYLLKHSGPNGEDDYSTMGFAIEGEDKFCPSLRSTVEERKEERERQIPQRRRYNVSRDYDDELYCC